MIAADVPRSFIEPSTSSRLNLYHCSGVTSAVPGVSSPDPPPCETKADNTEVGFLVSLGSDAFRVVQVVCRFTHTRWCKEVVL